MTPEQLLAQRAKQRRVWVELTDTKKVALAVLSPKSLSAVIRETASKSIVEQRVETAVRQAVDWSGFTEADIVDGGASDAVAFDARLWDAKLDEFEGAAWAAKCWDALQLRFAADAEKAEADAKN